MDMADSANRSIERQILGETHIEVRFTDGIPDKLILTDQGDEALFIRREYFRDRKISRAKYNDWVGRFTNEQQFSDDPEIIDSGMTLDEFYNKYLPDILDVESK